MWTNDGICDDGGAGSEFSLCSLGTDCTDCQVRLAQSSPPLPPPTPKPPPPAPTCKSWCASNAQSWVIKCTTFAGCVGCPECFHPPMPPTPISPPSSPSLPPPPLAEEVTTLEVRLKGSSGSTASCGISGGGCSFGYALALTPVLLSSSPSSGSEGEVLSITGHTLSLTPSENDVYVDGSRCEVLTAAVDGSYTPPACGALSCTQQMQSVVQLTCRLPHLDSIASHEVNIGIAGGLSPVLASATITTPPQLRAVAPASGSAAGGTLLTLYGDGLSTSLGDVEVTFVPSGTQCRVISTNSSQVTCITPVARNLTASSSVSVKLSVRGTDAICTADSCTYVYSQAFTPILTSATVSSMTSSEWQLSLSGTFGSGSDFPLDASEIYVGGVTPCVPTGVTASTLTCTSAPPLSGSQTITLSTTWGNALGDPSLPTVEGLSVSATSASLAGGGGPSTTLAGGATLTIAGSGFSTTATSVRVCGDACKVTSATSVALQCTAPSSLLHESGRQNLTLVADTSSSTNQPPSQPPMPSLPGMTNIVSLSSSEGMRLYFSGLTLDEMPRGAKLTSAELRVTPHSGSGGALIVSVKASLECALIESKKTTDWEMQPFDLGFASDKTPDVSSLLEDPIASWQSSGSGSCVVVVHLEPKEGRGVRHFYGPEAGFAERPQLLLTYDPPSTAEQLGWVADRSCAIEVAVPVPYSEDDVCTPINAAATRPVEDSSTCPHLHLEATAATSSESCALSVNGLNMFADAPVGCALDRIVTGRDGVCVVSLVAPSVPRAACFDTVGSSAGAERLASWIDQLPNGAPAMLVSCSRLAWGHHRNQLAASLASIGALNPPTHSDDAYALLGRKGASAPLAEARTACCENPDPVCETCDQTPAVASADTVCGEPAQTASTVLSGSFIGTFGSSSQVVAVSAATAPSSAIAVASGGPSTGLEAIAALQAEDVDPLDSACSSAIASSYGDRYGARLATDGDNSTYWSAVGVPDAVLTLDLGSARHVTNLTFDWKAPAHSILVLYSLTLDSDGAWSLGGSVQDLISVDHPEWRSLRRLGTSSGREANSGRRNE